MISEKATCPACIGWDRQLPRGCHVDICGRGVIEPAAFQELQVRGVHEGRGWKGELGSDMAGLEELGLSYNFRDGECSRLASFSCSLLVFYQQMSYRTQCAWYLMGPCWKPTDGCAGESGMVGFPLSCLL